MAKGKGSGGSMDFKVTASGLNKVDKDAKKAGSSFNTLDKNSRSTDRAMKGVSNMSSNTIVLRLLSRCNYTSLN